MSYSIAMRNVKQLETCRRQGKPPINTRQPTKTLLGESKFKAFASKIIIFFTLELSLKKVDFNDNKYYRNLRTMEIAYSQAYHSIVCRDATFKAWTSRK